MMVYSDFSNFDIAHLSTATNATQYMISGNNSFDYKATMIPQESDLKLIVNIQLAFWKDAKYKYLQLVKPYDHPLLENIVLVIASLFLSMTFLFGVNLDTKNGQQKTPSLIDMVKSWKLKKDRPDLYRNLVEMDDFFSDKIRHTDIDKVNSEITKLSKQKLVSFVETTRKVWIWFINKYCSKFNNGVVPPELLTDFQDINY